MQATREAGERKGERKGERRGERLSLEAFEAVRGEFDAAVDAASEVDRFCSRSEWVLPYHRAFLPERELFLYRDPTTRSFLTLASREHPSVGPYLESLENMWCFACPLIGPGALALLDDAIADLELGAGADGEGDAPVAGVPLVLSGLADERTPRSLLGRTVLALQDRYDVHAVDETKRYVASLEGGFDGWLARRTRAFRKGLRAAVRKVADEGFVFEHVELTSAEAARDVYPRILAIEGRSWKAADGSGVDSGSMREFYADMLPRLAARGGLRLLVVHRDGEDLGYLHGGVVGNHFRGLQLSYDHSYQALSLGNLLQRAMLMQLCEEGFASYDLGTRSDYKRRWAEEGLRTITVLARPRP